MVESLFTLNWWDHLAIFLILIFGLPHGAFDVSVGMCLGIYNNNKNKLIFISLYSIFSLIVIVLWYFFPQPILIIFLLTSIFHFGLGDFQWENNFCSYINGYINGGIVVFGISFMNSSEVNTIYSILVGQNVEMVWMFLKIGFLFWCLLFPINLYLNKTKIDRRCIFLWFLLFNVIYFFPPLLAFAIYFCFIHSFNHIKRILPILKKKLLNELIFKYFLSFTFLSWLIGLVVLLFLLQINSFDSSILQLTFVGLAALTFPHMVLVDIIFRPKLKV